MSSLDATFKELITRIEQGRRLSQTGFEPIYYLVFSPKQILAVKRQMPAWTAQLRNKGWTVHTFSMSDHILDILQNHRLRQIWLRGDERHPLEWDSTNQSLANALMKSDLQDRLMRALQDASMNENGIMLVTDLEALHPYMRIGVIENQLYEKFTIPTVFFYPGVRTGKSRLKFLGFYPEDGNYRSVHIGGQLD